MNKYTLTLTLPMLFAILTACSNSSIMVSSSKYLDYVEQKGIVHQEVSKLNVARVYPLSKMPVAEGSFNQEGVTRSIDEVEFNEVTVVTTIPEVLSSISADNLENLTATAPEELILSVQPPKTAWTEVEYINTLYTNTDCTSYRYATYSSYQVTHYDMGCAINVIGITSTGFYRLANDRYIPCEYLSEDGNYEPSATSRAVVYYD